MQLTYALALLGLFFVLLVGEFFVPSAGLVGITAAAAAVASISFAFSHSIGAGIGVTLTVIIGTPIVLYTMVKQWPHTPLGRRILNRRPGQIDAPTESRLRSGQKRNELIGMSGIARTDLLPAGLIEIDGQRLDAYSQGSPIDAGQRVTVVSVTAGKIRVRLAVDNDQITQQTETERSAKHLENALESLDLEEE